MRRLSGDTCVEGREEMSGLEVVELLWFLRFLGSPRLLNQFLKNQLWTKVSIFISAGAQQRRGFWGLEKFFGYGPKNFHSPVPNAFYPNPQRSISDINYSNISKLRSSSLLSLNSPKTLNTSNPTSLNHHSPEVSSN